jgi:hypothetical protein
MVGMRDEAAMSRTRTISDVLQEQIRREALSRGLARVEDFLEQGPFGEVERQREVVHRIDTPRERLTRKYGEFRIAPI